MHAYRYAEHSDKRSYYNKQNFVPGGVDKQHCGVKREYIGDNERRYSKLCCGDARFQRVCARDCRTRVSRKRDGRGDIRNYAEVEHEHVRRKHGHAHAYKNGRGYGCHYNVVRRRGYAHTEHYAAKHRQEEREYKRFRRNGND